MVVGWQLGCSLWAHNCGCLEGRGGLRGRGGQGRQGDPHHQMRWRGMYIVGHVGFGVEVMVARVVVSASHLRVLWQLVLERLEGPLVCGDLEGV